MSFTADTLSEDEEDEIRSALKRKGSNGGYTPAPGGPFSGLVPNMWPQDILAKLAQVGAKYGRSMMGFYNYRVGQKMCNSNLDTIL